MARPLLIGPEQEAQIALAIERALKHPVSLDTIKANAVDAGFVMSLEDRKGHTELVRPESEHVYLPIGFRASISFENQPSGLFRHLSISVDVPGSVPSPAAVEMIAKAFGFKMAGLGSAWIEEFDVGHHAVNIIELVNQPDAGHA